MRVWPIMKSAPSLHSHSTAEAIYSGRPIRRSGISRITASRRPGSCSIMPFYRRGSQWRPPRAKARAVARPMPEPAPVTSATLPSNHSVMRTALSRQPALFERVVSQFKLAGTIQNIGLVNRMHPRTDPSKCHHVFNDCFCKLDLLLLRSAIFSITWGIFISSVFLLFGCRCGRIFLIADLFQPLDDLAVERLLDGNVAHAGRRRRPVPMLFTGRAHDHIASADFLLGPAPTPHPPATGGNDQPLTQRVGMPSRAGAGFERNQRGGDARRIGCLEQRVDPHITGEIFRRTFGGRL